MAEPNNVVLEQLRAVRNDVAAFRSDIGPRIDRVEAHLANIETAHESRLERIERRLELSE